MILHFLRTGVAPRGEVSNGVFALRLGKCFSALFSRCVQKREEGRALRVQSYGLPLWCSIPKCGYFFVSLLYVFAFMRLFLVICVNLSGVKRFFVGTIHGL